MTEKKNLKLIIGIVVVICIAIVTVLMFMGGGSKSVEGVWIVDSYTLDNKDATADDVGAYYGTNYSEGNKLFSVEFTSDGKATLTIPIYDGSGNTEQKICDYEIKGNSVVLIAGNESVKAFKIKGDVLVAEKFINLYDNVEVFLKQK